MQFCYKICYKFDGLPVKKTGRGDYLYTRGGVFYFRRGVPADARDLFGCREVVVSLGTSDLSEARHRLTSELRGFEYKLAQVRRTVAPAERIARISGVPSLDELEVGVRSWLKARNERFAHTLSSLDLEGEASAISTLEAERNFLESASSGSLSGSVSTDWIATHLIEVHDWELEIGSPLYRRLKRLILRGQIEANERAKQEILVEPLRLLDERFGPERYLADAQRAAPTRPRSLEALFAKFVIERQLKPATIKAYRLQFAEFLRFVDHDDAHQVTADDLVRWKDYLLARTTRTGKTLSTRTIRDKYFVVVKAVFAWARANKYVAENPAEYLTIARPKRQRLRASGLTDQEASLILSASLQPVGPRITPKMAFARRWVPWLCAYTGARVNEMTQLRAEDVQLIDGIWCVRITPEAGSVKDDEARIVAIHSHLIELGFIDQVEGQTGPLFYDPGMRRGGGDGNPQFKKVGERLGSWVRKEVGVNDPNVQPNHGWRHRFVTLSRRYGIPEDIRRAITGHAPGDTGDRYGDHPIDVLKREIEKLPRIAARATR